MLVNCERNKFSGYIVYIAYIAYIVDIAKAYIAYIVISCKFHSPNFKSSGVGTSGHTDIQADTHTCRHDLATTQFCKCAFPETFKRGNKQTNV